MSKLLVSVRDAREAALAVEAGVDLIDVKEPHLGSLGAASVSVIGEIVAAVAGRVPLSVALGELADKPAIESAVLSQVSYAKLGLARCVRISDWRERWERLLAELPQSVSRVAVVYADEQNAESPPEGEILEAATDLNCRAVLLDTWSKKQGPVTSHWSSDRIRSFVLAVQKSKMLAVIGGGLRSDSFEQVLRMSPDFLAVRGAVCDGDRTGPVSLQKMIEVKAGLATFLQGTHSPHVGRSQRSITPKSVA